MLIPAPPTVIGGTTNVQVMQVTPTIAAHWLTRNENNRTIRPHQIDAYCRDMTAGRWLFDGAPIRFDTDGILLDGQHRLTALVRAGVTLPMVVIVDLPPETQQVMDTGAKRTAADALGLEGVKNPNLLASTARFALMVSPGRREQAGFRATNTEITDLFEARPRLADAVHHYVAHYGPSKLLGTVGCYLLWEAREVSDDATADRFFQGLTTRVGLPAGSPLLALDNRLAGHTSRGHRGRVEQLALGHRAWNAWATGRAMARMQLTYDDKKYPVVPELVRPHV